MKKRQNSPASTSCLGETSALTEGREPGDRKSLLVITAKASVTHSTGSKIFFVRTRGFARLGASSALRSTPTLTVELHPIAIDMSPAEAGSEFRRLSLPNLIHSTSKILHSRFPKPFPKAGKSKIFFDLGVGFFGWKLAGRRPAEFYTFKIQN